MEYKYIWSGFIGALLMMNSCSHANTNSASEVQNTNKTSTAEVHKKHNSIKLMSIVAAIGALPASISKFIPDGFAALDTASGDLNMDGISDMILVLKPLGEDTTEEYKNRPVMILTGSESGQYTLAKRNDNIAYCYRCGGIWGDPFIGITIKNNYFSIENGITAGRHWEHIITFKYDKSKSNWYLSRDGFESYKLNSDKSGDASALVMDVQKIKTKKDFGEVTFSEFDIHKDW